MELKITGTPKEIADLVVEVQNRQEALNIKPLDVMLDSFKIATAGSQEEPRKGLKLVEDCCIPIKINSKEKKMEINIKDVKDVKKILCQQLELLAEISRDGIELSELIVVSQTMCTIAEVLFTEVN